MLRKRCRSRYVMGRSLEDLDLVNRHMTYKHNIIVIHFGFR